MKSYLKCGRAFRIETIINDTGDLGVARRLEHLPDILSKARDVNRRMVDAFRVGQGCALASPAFERVARPSLVDGRRASALRFGDPRVMALAGALCACLHTAHCYLRSLIGAVGQETAACRSRARMSRRPAPASWPLPGGVALCSGVPRHTTDSTALDLARRISTEFAT
ncbi:MAG: hypothetical protein ACREX8_11145 [Gammaproteobacteria bacterium]